MNTQQGVKNIGCVCVTSCNDGSLTKKLFCFLIRTVPCSNAVNNEEAAAKAVAFDTDGPTMYHFPLIYFI